jgi:hypothetical protein
MKLQALNVALYEELEACLKSAASFTLSFLPIRRMLLLLPLLHGQVMQVSQKLKTKNFYYIFFKK